ncbi:CCB3/YggT [Sesbania bispinosa]|nr:CCB3/YggT [Sesbania bispinosa]
MALSAATMGVASQASMRLLVFQPIQHRRSDSSSSVVVKRRNVSFCVGSHSHCNRTPLISSPPSDILSGSTRTVTTLLGMAVLCIKAFAKIPVPNLLSNSANMPMSMGTLFFASLRDRPGGYLNTPLTVVAAGLGKWLDIYSGVLMVRVLLSWFPNIPWERQPLSAIRDLCDPYLNLFRNIIPPVFDTLDVSPLLAFAVLGTLGSILQTAMT